MFKNIVNFIKDESFYINIANGKLNIVNYENIVIMEESKIIVTSRKEKVTIKGEGLSISKLLEKELLITGVVLSIEFGAM